jgi:hypothetical protein
VGCTGFGGAGSKRIGQLGLGLRLSWKGRGGIAEGLLYEPAVGLLLG